MLEDLPNIFSQNYFILIYGAALIISMMRYRRYFDTALKYLPIIIAYTFFNEILGFFIKYSKDFQFVFIERYAHYNVILYNLYFFVFFLFFYFVYWNSLKKESDKKLIKIGAITYVLITLINLFFQNPILQPLYYAYAIGAIVLILGIAFYLKQIFHEKDNPYKHYNNLLLWVSLGLLIFFLVDPILLIIAIENDYVYIKYNLQKLLHILIVMMYTLFIIGFLLVKRRAFR